MNTKKVVSLLAVSVALLWSVQASAQVRKAGHFGVGVGSGTIASGFSGKYFPDATTAFQFNVGFHNTTRAFYGDALGLGFDYLLEQSAFAGDKRFGVAWNIGPGVSLGYSEGRYRDFWLIGVSAVIGLELLLEMIPLDVVLEYRPSVFFFNDNFNDRGRDGFDLDLIEFGGHVRYFF